MKVPYETLRSLDLLRDYEIIDFFEDADSGDVLIVYADRAVQPDGVEVYAVKFDIELEHLEFDPRNYRRLPPEREETVIQETLERRAKRQAMPEDEEDDLETEYPF